MEKKLDGNYTRMLRTILNKFWRQHPIKHQLYGHLPPITKTIQVRWTRHAEHCRRSKEELISDILLWTPSHRRAKARLPAIYNSSVPIQDIALKTSRERWTQSSGSQTPPCTIYIYIYVVQWRKRVREIRAGSAIHQNYQRRSLYTHQILAPYVNIK